MIELEDLKKLIEHPLPKWVTEARETSDELKALKYGKNFHDLLIHQIEHIEQSERAKARRKYSKDIRDLFYRVYEPRENVYSADGASDEWRVEGARKENINRHFKDYKNGQSIDSYLSSNLFQLSDVDPNGFLFTEYKEELGNYEIYPTYKSIHDVRNYDSSGLCLKWVLFEPLEDNQTGDKYWRYVDDTTDYMVLERNNQYSIVEEFDHPFGKPPAVLLSPVQETGKENRLSWLFFVTELAKQYASDRSVYTIYKYLQGFPKHWKYVQICRKCNGSGKIDGSDCPSCGGTGRYGKQDVTDDIEISLPEDKETDLVVAPNIAGWITTDIEFLNWAKQESRDLEDLIYKTVWGTTKEKNQSGSETATGRYIDIQPVINRLNVFSYYAEEVHNMLSQFVINIVDRVEDQEDIYKKVYGRRFILEPYDELVKKYNEAKKNETSVAVLDQMLNEVICSRYKTDMLSRLEAQNKIYVEPYPHYTIEHVQEILGERDSIMKYLFSEWSKDQDFSQDKNVLKEQFNIWFNQKYNEYEQRGETESV